MVPIDDGKEDDIIDLDEEPELDLERVEEEMENYYSGEESEPESDDNDVAWVAGVEKIEQNGPKTVKMINFLNIGILLTTATKLRKLNATQRDFLDVILQSKALKTVYILNLGGAAKNVEI